MPANSEAGRAHGIPKGDIGGLIRGIPGLVAHWPLSDGATSLRDVIGGRVLSTLSGSAPTFRGGSPPPLHRGNVARWAGAGGLTITGTQGLPVGDTRRTIFLRFRTSSSGVMVPFCYGTAGGPESTILLDFNYPATGNITFNTWNTLTKVADGPINDGRWHSVAFVWFGGGRGGAAYLDFTTTFRWTQAAIATLTGSIGIGRDTLQAVFAWDGDIADIAVWNRALTRPEFAALARAR